MTVKSWIILLALTVSSCAASTSSKGTSGGDPELRGSDGSLPDNEGLVIGSFGDDLHVQLCATEIISVDFNQHMSSVRLAAPTLVNVSPSGGFLPTRLTPFENRQIQDIATIMVKVEALCGRAYESLNAVPFAISVARVQSDESSALAHTRLYTNLDHELVFNRAEGIPFGTRGTAILDPRGYYPYIVDAFMGGQQRDRCSALDEAFENGSGLFSIAVQ